MKEQKQVFNSPKIDENHATIMKKMPKIMNHAKTSKNMKNDESMPSGTPASYALELIAQNKLRLQFYEYSSLQCIEMAIWLLLYVKELV